MTANYPDPDVVEDDKDLLIRGLRAELARSDAPRVAAIRREQEVLAKLSKAQDLNILLMKQIIELHELVDRCPT